MNNNIYLVGLVFLNHHDYFLASGMVLLPGMLAGAALWLNLQRMTPALNRMLEITQTHETLAYWMLDKNLYL
jgi:hypothetical protein